MPWVSSTGFALRIGRIDPPRGSRVAIEPLWWAEATLTDAEVSDSCMGWVGRAPAAGARPGRAPRGSRSGDAGQATCRGQTGQAASPARMRRTQRMGGVPCEMTDSRCVAVVEAGCRADAAA